MPKNKQNKERPLDFMSGKSRKGNEFDEPSPNTGYTRNEDRITPFEPEKQK